MVYTFIKSPDAPEDGKRHGLTRFEPARRRKDVLNVMSNL
jgi:hypothetical protein